MAHVTVFCFLASYLVAFLLELSRLLGRSRISRFVMVGFGVAGFAAHTWYLLNRAHQTHLPPLLSSTHDWMLVLAWVLVLFYLFITLLLALSRQDLAVGVFALPVVLLLVSSTYLLNQEPNAALTEAAARARWSWGILHAALLVFGMTAGAIGLVSGSMYLIQHHRLKTRHAEPTGFRIPSLARLAQANRWSIILTYFLLTLGFASGVYLGISTPGGASMVGYGDPAVVISGLVWLLFGVLFARLWGQRAPGGRQVAWLTIGGCGFLLVTLLGLQILTGSIHSAAASGSHPSNSSADSEGRP
ncbi:MAG TPA: cytochrome c biogenesis protein CcsA [Planctomycetaceae bacterium]|nr:cytochrome c biogenesis protein CcsA [Planctomycetaceae bacterium]